MKFGWLKENGLLIKSHYFAMRCALILRNSSVKAWKIMILTFMAIFCFFNNFLFKSYNKISLILRRCSRSVPSIVLHTWSFADVITRTQQLIIYMIVMWISKFEILLFGVWNMPYDCYVKWIINPRKFIRHNLISTS